MLPDDTDPIDMASRDKQKTNISTSVSTKSLESRVSFPNDANMVVNRKQPVIPVPPSVSRSSSTQPLPTKKVTKTVTKPTQPQNGHEIDSRKTTSKTTKLKIKKRKSRSLLDRIFVISLSVFAFYAFYTCRPNPLFPSSPSNSLIHDPNPLCRSLATYRTHVLDPYVLPPLRYGISFTRTIAEPYVIQTRSHIDPYVAPVVRTVDTIKPYAVRAVSVTKNVWNGTLVPLYTHTLKPYWVKAVVPRYIKHVHPRLLPVANQAKRYYRYYVANPLHIQSVKIQKYIHTIYAVNIKPYVMKVQPHVEQTLDTIHTTSIHVFGFYNTHVHPRVVAGWAVARPLLCQTLKFGKDITLQAIDVTGKQLKWATKEAGSLRRTYVDPQVRKIWDKVAEGTELATGSTPLITEVRETGSQVTIAHETAESDWEPTPTDTQVASETNIVTTTEIPEAEHTLAADPQVPTPEEIAEDEPQAPGIHAGARTAPPPVDAEETILEPVVVAEAKEEVASSPAPAPTDAPAPTPEEEFVVPVSVVSESVTPAPTASPIVAEEELDLDDFLNELGVSDAAPTVEPAAEETTISLQEVAEPVLTPEEVLAKIAAKRLDIVTRHEAWFGQMDEGIEEETLAFSKALEDWRNLKAVELEDMKKRGAVESVQKDGEKLLKGLDSFLKKAEGKSAAWKISKDQKKLEDISLEDKVEAYKSDITAKKVAAKQEKDKWENVLAKVEEKFSERVRQLQVEVHTWYMTMREHEGELITESSSRIKSLAERAQADLGLDYAWLEDVTYEDWQLYHDLVREAEKYEQTAYAMQNSTSPNSPRDPILPLLNALDQDVQDVVLGFQVALSRVRGDAAKVYSIHPDPTEDEDSGFFVVNDGQVRRDDLRGVDFGDLGLKKKTEGAGVVGLKSESESSGKTVDDGEVHILPIDPVENPDDSAFDASKIIVGKDKVQIEQALRDVPVETVHEEL